MSAPGPGQSSVAKAGWLIALLFFGWLVFLFVPGPKKTGPQPAPPPVKPPPSRLVALGLPDNTDLEHLPEYFALYADKAEWKDDKTIFAYWNPGSNSYSYFFEAIRLNGGYHFKVIPQQIAAEPESEEVYESGLRWGDNLPKECQLRFLYTDEQMITNYKRRFNVIHEIPNPTVEVKIDYETIKPPVPNVKLSPPNLEKK